MRERVIDQGQANAHTKIMNKPKKNQPKAEIKIHY